MNRLAGLVAIVLVAAACQGTSIPPPEGQLGTPTAAPTAAPTPTQEPAPTIEPIPTLEPLLDPETMIALGESAVVAEGDWTIVVGKPDFDAWLQVVAENQFNDKPPKGYVDVLIPVRATYNGSGRTELDASLHFMVLGEGTRTEISDFDDPACGVIAKDLGYDGNKTVRNGGKVSGNLCYGVPKEDIDSLVLLWSDDEFGFDGDFVEFALR